MPIEHVLPFHSNPCVFSSLIRALIPLIFINNYHSLSSLLYFSFLFPLPLFPIYNFFLTYIQTSCFSLLTHFNILFLSFYLSHHHLISYYLFPLHLAFSTRSTYQNFPVICLLVKSLHVFTQYRTKHTFLICQ